MVQPGGPQGVLATLTSNLATKLISVVIEIVLWIVVLGSRNVEITKEVPLEFITAPEFVVGPNTVDRVAFRLGGPKAFLRSILDRREEPIKVNLVGQKPGNVKYRIFQVNIQLPIGVKVISITPTPLEILLEELAERDVPLKAELRGIPPEGVRVVSTTLKPDFIHIKGGKSRVDAVVEILTMPVDVSTLAESTEIEVSLDISRLGVSLDANQKPKLRIETEQLPANFKIKDVEIRVVSAYKALVEPGNLAVMVRATQDALKSVDRAQVYAVADLKGRPKGIYQIPVRVVLPKGIGFVRTVPETIQVKLQ